MASSTATLPPPTQMPDLGGRETLLSRMTGLMSKYSMVVALLIVIVVFAITTDGIIIRDQNISNIIVQNGYILILAIGMVMVIIGGHIDLSVGSVAGFVGAVVAVLMMQLHWEWYLATLAGLVVGALVGAFQGFWIAIVGIPSFIVTLAGMLLFRGLTLALIGSTNIGSFPQGFTDLGSGFLSGSGDGIDLLTVGIGAVIVLAVVVWQANARRTKIKHGEAVSSVWLFLVSLVVIGAAVMVITLALARYRGLPMVLVILAVLAIGYTILMRRTVFGRHVYAIGGNRKAAQLSGVKGRKIDFLLFVNMGVLAALAGIILTARLNLATSGAGTGMELEAIAAAFVGGAAVQGGIGTIPGAIIGGLTIGVINNGMSIMGLGTQWQQTVLGIVVLLVVAFDILNKRRGLKSAV